MYRLLWRGERSSGGVEWVHMNYLYWAPRAVAVLGILFISSFALDVFVPGVALASILVALVIHLVPSIMLALLLALAWQFERIGGTAFILVSFLPFIFLSNPVWVNAILCAPFLLVGVLFLLHAHYTVGK